MDNQKSSFDKLVAGLTSEDRNAMLDRINKAVIPSVQFEEMDKKPPEYNMTLSIRLQNENIFYRFVLWLRAIIQKRSSEKIYNEDIISKIAKKINHEHPGLVDHKNFLLDEIFYERLRNLKECSDFFKPYILLIDENPGDFYVFLSSFVAPEISEAIMQQADPFTLSFGQEPSIELKNTMIKKMDEILKDIDEKTKSNLYLAVQSINWLKQFTRLPFIHFSSQFTNVGGGSFSCPYNHAKFDFNEFANVFGNILSIDNNVLEAMYLFSQRKELTNNVQDKDIERALKEFLTMANEFLSTIEMFIAGVPVLSLGKVLNSDYNWEPGSIPGAEAWFPSFKTQWKKIFDIRWNEWIKERKKHMLESNLQRDFNLSEFPMIKYRPWEGMWSHVPFNCELTGGFICWFALEKFDKIIELLNGVMLDGIFIRSENRSEYTEAVNGFAQVNNKMIALVGKLSPEGTFGAAFQEIADSKIRNIQTQKQVDKMISATEAEVRDITKEFGKNCRTIERVFHGFFDEKKDGIHEGLSNINTIKGRDNRKWRDEMEKARELLIKCIFYISELEPIDASL